MNSPETPDSAIRATLSGLPPVMTRETFALVIGLPPGVFLAQCERGYWPLISRGRRVFVNVEAVRLQALQEALAGQ